MRVTVPFHEAQKTILYPYALSTTFLASVYNNLPETALHRINYIFILLYIPITKESLRNFQIGTYNRLIYICSTKLKY